VADGAKRASEVAVANLLRRLKVIGEAEAARLAGLLETPLHNRAGRMVGHIRMADDAGA
jgi:L-asparaginase II